MSVIFEQLRVSGDSRKMYIDAHVGTASYFENRYITTVIIKTAEQITKSGLSPETSDGDNVYSQSFDDSVFYGCTNLHNITLPSTLTAMGKSVFQASGIYNLEIPEGIKTIPNYTVYQCASLEEIILPSTVTAINTGALRACTLLERVIVRATTPPTLAADAFRDTKVNGIIYVPQGCKSAYEATVWNNSTANYYPKSRGWTIEELDADGNIPV